MLDFHLPGFFLDNFWFIILIASAITFPLAWVADAAFGEQGFGLIGNYILLMIGSICGAAALMLYWGSATRVMDAPHWPFFAAAAGGTTLILAACLLKRLIRR